MTDPQNPLTELKCLRIDDPLELNMQRIATAGAVAHEILNATLHGPIDVQVGTTHCSENGFHAVNTVNGRHGISHVHWDEKREANDYATQIQDTAKELLASIGINPLTHPIYLN